MRTGDFLYSTNDIAVLKFRRGARLRAPELSLTLKIIPAKQTRVHAIPAIRMQIIRARSSAAHSEIRKNVSTAFNHRLKADKESVLLFSLAPLLSPCKNRARYEPRSVEVGVD